MEINQVNIIKRAIDIVWDNFTSRQYINILCTYFVILSNLQQYQLHWSDENQLLSRRSIGTQQIMLLW